MPRPVVAYQWGKFDYAIVEIGTDPQGKPPGETFGHVTMSTLMNYQMQRY